MIRMTMIALCLMGLFALPIAVAQTVEDFDSIQLYTLKNAAGMTVKVTNYGAIITSIVVPDRNGKMSDITLGYNRVEDYINAVDRPYFGAIVGRYGNRIAKGKFSLNGQSYVLAANNGENHLHGGIIGFDKVVWTAKPIGNMAIELTYRAKDKEEGYPGNVNIQVTYSITDQNELKVDYQATTDKATPINLTQHAYFNLKGEGEGDILGHELMIAADKFTPVDPTLIPTGEVAPVQGTPLDFTSSKPIGRDIASDHQQMKFGGGFDHNFVINRSSPTDTSMQLAARVYEPTTGRTLEVTTTEPGMQFYCGNFLDGRLKGKSGKAYVHRGGFCLETQHFPDSPNQPTFPTCILQPGKTFRSTTIFRFGSK